MTRKELNEINTEIEKLISAGNYYINHREIENEVRTNGKLLGIIKVMNILGYTVKNENKNDVISRTYHMQRLMH